MLYSYKTQYPDALPDRIRLSDGSTRTNKNEFTDEEIADAGYVLAPPYPDDVTTTQKVEWTGTDWIVINFTDSELQTAEEAAWVDIRKLRDSMLLMLDWRIMRAQSELRMGKVPTEDILQLDQYAQALRDITTQSDPFNIVWPQLSLIVSEE